ncbi:MAG: hypothetical protein V4583_06685 [Pseudomonadota bacterium]
MSMNPLALCSVAILMAGAAEARNLGTSLLDKAEAGWVAPGAGNQGKNGKLNGNAGGTKPVVIEEPVPEEPAPEEPAPEEPAPEEPAPEEPAPEEPAPEEPAPTEPGPEEPAPTEPGPEESAPSDV